MILFDSEYLTIEFKNVPCRHLVASWSRLPGDATYREGCATILRCCHENEIRNLVSDIGFQDKLIKNSEPFSENAIASFAARHGCLYHAVVLSSEVFLRFGLADFDRSVADKDHVQQFFANRQDAISWLQEANS